MSKVEIAGPRELLEKTLFTLQDSGLLQIEPSSRGFVDSRAAASIDSYLPDRQSISMGLFLENMKGSIDELFTCLRTVPRSKSTLDPRPVLESINSLVQRHGRICRELGEKRQSLIREEEDTLRHYTFLDSVSPLLREFRMTADRELIGLTLRDPQAVTTLKKFLSGEAGTSFQLRTAPSSEGGVVGLIAVHKDLAGRIKNALSDKNIPELRFPVSFEGTSVYEKMDLLRKRSAEIDGEIDALDMQIQHIATQWGPVYRRTREWIEEQLSVLNAEGSVFETSMCFLIYGWMATDDVTTLNSSLTDRFDGKVVLEEMEVHEEDLSEMPVILKNPPYFKPFELLTGILPLPRYTSYDPTPFIGIFFPLFFGMILGDCGYALIIMALSLYLIKGQKKALIADIGKILLASSVYTFVFGIVYGEAFGDAGQRLLHLEPLFVERSRAIIPMLYFAVSVGVVHVLIGTVLGIVGAFRKKTKREAVGKSIHLITIIAILTLIASLFGFFPKLLTRPVMIAILLLAPLLLFTGGLLAPLELLKSMGNIISYARIMAIGLTSVLLAHVANRLAGMTGDIITGIVVACLLHLLNLIIGIVSPALHALRLHYVEFFSKFLEPGGRKFQPFRKKESL